MSKRGIPGQGLNQITQQQATFQALDEMGDQTSLAMLQERAEEIYGGPIASGVMPRWRWQVV